MSEHSHKDKDQLNKVVKSRMKGLGLDALFHQVDKTQKDSDSSETRAPLPSSVERSLISKLKDNMLYCPESKGWVARTKELLEYVSASSPLLHIGLSVSASSVKWIEMKYMNGMPILNNARYIPIPHLASTHQEKLEEFIVQSLTEFVDREKLKKAFVSLLVPQGKVILKMLSLPTPDLREVKKMIHFEAEHHLPFPVKDVESDYHVLKQEHNETQLMLAAIKKDDLAWYTRVLEQAGIALDAVEVSALSLYNISSFAPAQKGTTVQVNIGSMFTDINIVDQGLLKYARGVPLGSRGLTAQMADRLNVSFENADNIKKQDGILLSKKDANDLQSQISDQSVSWADQLVHHLRRTIQFFQINEGVSYIDRIVLSGGGSQLENLNEHLKDALKIKTIQQKYPSDIQINCDPKCYQKNFQELYCLLGATWRGRSDVSKTIDLNLLPQSIKDATCRRKKKVKMLTAAVALAGCFLLFLVVPASLLGLRQLRIGLLERKLQSLRPKAIASLELQRKIRTIEDYISAKESSMEVLKEISTLVTQDIVIRRFAFEKNKKVILTGEAGSHASAVNLSGLLRRSSFFESATLKYTRKRKKLGDDVDFEISCQLVVKE